MYVCMYGLHGASTELHGASMELHGAMELHGGFHGVPDNGYSAGS